MNKLIVALLFTLLAAGCTTTPSQQDAGQPPKHAGRVKVSMYDLSPRTKSDHFEVFDVIHLIQKPYKEIALLTCDGTVNEEGVMTEAIIYRARMIGADAVIILERNNYQEGIGPYGGGATRSVYRGKAVVYEP